MLFDHRAGERASSKHHVETGNRGVSRSHQRRPTDLPLKAMECGKFSMSDAFFLAKHTSSSTTSRAGNLMKASWLSSHHARTIRHDHEYFPDIGPLVNTADKVGCCRIWASCRSRSLKWRSSCRPRNPVVMSSRGSNTWPTRRSTSG